MGAERARVPKVRAATPALNLLNKKAVGVHGAPHPVKQYAPGGKMSTVEAPNRGAGWHRAALQVNPFGYVGHPAPSDSFENEAAYNEALLDECEANGVSIIAVTDHWKVSTAVGLIDAAKKRNIVALPGFEANCSEGFHLLVIFEAGTDIDWISTNIGACGVPEADPHGPGDKSFSDIAETMTKKGALVIPAHVNVATSGLLARFSGKPLQKVVASHHILALATTPSRPPLGDQIEIIKNLKPYHRSHPLVEIFADDVSHPSTLANEGATSWFKMGKPSLRGLHHALRTPQTRVRLTPPPPLRGTRLCSVSWAGGFLDGLKIPIGPELTALIGGRGTGKSTVIESIRYALDQPPQGEDALKDHRSVVQKVLGAGAVVSLEVEALDPTPARYTIKRTVGDPPIVLDASGERIKQLPLDVVGELEAFGQHELAEMAQDKNLLASLIRRLGGDFASEANRENKVEIVKQNRLDLLQLEKQLEALEADLSAIPRLKEQEDRFKESDLGTKLDAQKQINDEKAVLDEQSRRISVAIEKIAEFDHQSLTEELGRNIESAALGDRARHLQDSQRAARDLGEVIAQAFSAIDAATAKALSELSKSRDSWNRAVQPDLESHASTVRDLVSAGFDPDAYLRTAAALKALTLRQEERAKLQSRHAKLLDERRKLLGQLTLLDTAIASELNSAINATNEATRGKVNVRPIASPDRSHIKAIIDRNFKTPRTQIMAAIDAGDFSVLSFVEAIRAGAAALSKYGITGSQATNLVALGEPLTRELEEQTVGLAVDVYLNVAASGTELRRLDDLSKGQRATALLLLLLGVTTTPLIIDQPEDDLDNRFVYDGIVQHLRDLKGVRQILVSTHNANVPVLGDAELVVVLESDGRHGTTALNGVGSLDETAIRGFAEKILEGGEEAFRARRHLYGF